MAGKWGKLAVGGLAGTAGAGLATYLLLKEQNDNVIGWTRPLRESLS